MKKLRVRHIGLLSNVDESILGLNRVLGHPIRALDQTETFQILTQVEHLSPPKVFQFLSHDLACFNYDEKKTYAMEDWIEIADTRNSAGTFQGLSPELHAHDKAVQDQLLPRIQALRLIANGNLQLPYESYHYELGGRLFPVMGRGTILKVGSSPYTLKGKDIKKIGRDVRRIQLPFNYDYVNLALEDFDLSYRTDRPALAFLVLMIALEALFNQGANEVTFSVARNVAVILGVNRADAEHLFGRVKKLYGERSRIVHRGDMRGVTATDLDELRTIVRRSVLATGLKSLPKEELFRLLSASGYRK